MQRKKLTPNQNNKLVNHVQEHKEIFGDALIIDPVILFTTIGIVPQQVEYAHSSVIAILDKKCVAAQYPRLAFQYLDIEEDGFKVAAHMDLNGERIQFSPGAISQQKRIAKQLAGISAIAEMRCRPEFYHLFLIKIPPFTSDDPKHILGKFLSTYTHYKKNNALQYASHASERIQNGVSLQEFNCILSFRNIPIASAKGHTKIVAEETVAREMLRRLQFARDTLTHNNLLEIKRALGLDNNSDGIVVIPDAARLLEILSVNLKQREVKQDEIINNDDPEKTLEKFLKNYSINTAPVFYKTCSLQNEEPTNPFYICKLFYQGVLIAKGKSDTAMLAERETFTAVLEMLADAIDLSTHKKPILSNDEELLRAITLFVMAGVDPTKPLLLKENTVLNDAYFPALKYLYDSSELLERFSREIGRCYVSPLNITMTMLGNNTGANLVSVQLSSFYPRLAVQVSGKGTNPFNALHVALTHILQLLQSMQLILSEELKNKISNLLKSPLQCGKEYRKLLRNTFNHELLKDKSSVFSILPNIIILDVQGVDIRDDQLLSQKFHEFLKIASMNILLLLEKTAKITPEHAQPDQDTLSCAVPTINPNIYTNLLQILKLGARPNPDFINLLNVKHVNKDMIFKILQDFNVKIDLSKEPDTEFSKLSFAELQRLFFEKEIIKGNAKNVAQVIQQGIRQNCFRSTPDVIIETIFTFLVGNALTYAQAIKPRKLVAPTSLVKSTVSHVPSSFFGAGASAHNQQQTTNTLEGSMTSLTLKH